ncbi:MAG: lipase family protein [Cyanobacteria bacterium P01_G01_bin.49]
MGKILKIPYERFQLDLEAKGYSPKNSLSMAMACYLSYQSQSKLQEQLREWGFSHFARLEANKGLKIDTQGFVATNNNLSLIVFRGSESIQDWMANFTIVTDAGPFQGTRIHEGFQDALFPVVMDLTEEIIKHGGGNQPLWITGHSLGGALATILTAMYLERDRKVECLYTFGSPRVGNESFRTNFNQRFYDHTYRVVNGNDLVPHVPPEPLFSHVGQPIIFDANGKRQDHALSLWERIQVKVKGTLLQDFGDGQLSGVERHLLDDDDGYLPRLLKDL